MTDVSALLLQWIWYVAAVLVIGAAGAYTTISRWARSNREARDAHAAMRGELRRCGLAGAAALVLFALLRLAARAAGGGVPPTFESMSRIVSGTAWGTGWWMQLYVALLAMAGLLIAHRRPRQGWSLAAAAALGVAYTLPMTGESGAAMLDRLALVAAAVHVFGAGIWMGVPLLMTVARRAAVRRDGLAAAAKRTLAMGVALTVIAGVAGAALQLDGIGALWGTFEGRMLTLKAAAATAAAAWALSRPDAALGAGAVALLLTVLL